MIVDRVVFLQPYLAQYRVPFYEQLQNRLDADGMRLEVAVGGDSRGRGDEGRFPVTVWPDRLEHLSGGRLRLRAGRVGASDLLVMEQAVKNIDGWQQVLRMRNRRPGLALWGHGRTYAPAARPTRSLKRVMTNRADWFFAYTGAGARTVVAGGFPASRVTVVGNTIDTDQLRAELRAVSDADVRRFREDLGLAPGRTAVFLGSVDEGKDVRTLVEAAGRLAQRLPGFVLLVAGQGPAMARLTPTPPHIRVLGRADGPRKALVLRSADVLTVPGGVGLVAVDSLVAGLPMVLRSGPGHGPEAVYLSDSTSVRVSAEAGSDGYAAAVEALLLDEARRERLAHACREASQQHSMSSMVAAFHGGLLALRDIHEFGL